MLNLRGSFVHTVQMTGGILVGGHLERLHRCGKMKYYEGKMEVVHNAPSYNVPFCPICLFMGFGSRAKNKVINESCFVLNL